MGVTNRYRIGVHFCSDAANGRVDGVRGFEQDAPEHVRESEPIREPIGVRLRRLRLDRGLSQRELASQGVSYAYISRIEAGTRRPSVKALRMLARKLGVSPEYLETGSELRDVDERELKLADAELRLRIGGEPDPARAQFAALLDEALDAGDIPSSVRAQIGLGLSAAKLGDYVTASHVLQEAVDLGTLSPLDRPDVFATLGHSYAAAGAHERAIELLQSCLDHIDEHDSENVSAYIRFAGYLSSELSDRGELGRAEAVLTNALARAEGAADAYTRIRLYWSIARLAEYEGRATRALEYVRKAIALLEATEDTMHLARAHLLCAWIMGIDDRAAEAEPHLERAEALLGPNPDQTDLAMLRVEQARIAFKRERGDDAVRYGREALELLGVDHVAEQGSAWWAVGEGLVLQDDVAGATDAFARAVSRLDEAKRWREAAQCCRRWAKVLRDAGRDADALDALERATDYAVRSQPTAHTPLEH